MPSVILKVTSKGQVTLQKSVLEHLGVKPGDRLVVETRPGGEVALKTATPEKPTTIRDLYGMFHTPGMRAVSIEEMNDIIARGWAGEFSERDEP